MTALRYATYITFIQPVIIFDLVTFFNVEEIPFASRC